jgi:site-specific recombinase XerC
LTEEGTQITISDAFRDGRQFGNDACAASLAGGIFATRPIFTIFLLLLATFLLATPQDRSKMSPDDYRAWQQSRGASDQTLRHILCALASIFRFAELIEAVPVSPARAVQTRRLKRRLPKIPSVEQVNSLIDAGTNPRDKSLLEFF